MSYADLGFEELAMRDEIAFLRGQIDRLEEEHELAVAELIEKETELAGVERAIRDCDADDPDAPAVLQLPTQ